MNNRQQQQQKFLYSLTEKLSDTHYIVVDDSEIKERVKVLTDDNEIATVKYIHEDYVNFIDSKNNSLSIVNDPKRFKVITHSTKPIELGNIDGTCEKDLIFDKIKPLSLSEVEEAINGYSVEKIKKEYNQGNNQDVFTKGIEQGIEIGFKAHQELVKDKLFTIEDIKTFYKCVKTHTFDEAMSLIFPKTEWGIEIDEQGKLKLI